jgi:hypothetical protein
MNVFREALDREVYMNWKMTRHPWYTVTRRGTIGMLRHDAVLPPALHPDDVLTDSDIQ